MAPKIIAGLMLLIGNAIAGTVTLEWDANAPEDQVDDYGVYELVGGNWTAIADSATTTITLTNVTPAQHTYAVTAKNIWAESERSDSVTTAAGAPAAPQHLHIPGKVALNIEKSPDLIVWEPATTIYFDDADRMFFRMDLEP